MPYSVLRERSFAFSILWGATCVDQSMGVNSATSREMPNASARRATVTHTHSDSESTLHLSSSFSEQGPLAMFFGHRERGQIHAVTLRVH